LTSLSHGKDLIDKRISPNTGLTAIAQPHLDIIAIVCSHAKYFDRKSIHGPAIKQLPLSVIM